MTGGAGLFALLDQDELPGVDLSLFDEHEQAGNPVCAGCGEVRDGHECMALFDAGR